MTKYQRKTCDLWDVIGLYPVNNRLSVEVVTTCTTWKEAKQSVKTYRENEPCIRFRLKQYREKIDN